MFIMVAAENNTAKAFYRNWHYLCIKPISWDYQSVMSVTIFLYINLKKWASPCIFLFIFVFSTVNNKYVHFKILPVTGFELRTSGIGSDCSVS